MKLMKGLAVAAMLLGAAATAYGAMPPSRALVLDKTLAAPNQLACSNLLAGPAWTANGGATVGAGAGPVTVAFPAGVPLAVDSQETAQAGHASQASPLSWSFTNADGNFLIVGVNMNSSVANTVGHATVTYGGRAMTELSGSYETWDLDTGAVSLFYLANPPLGANTVSVSWTPTGTTAYYDTIAGAISFRGVNTATPFGTPAVAFNDSSNVGTAQVTVPTSTSGNFLVGFAGAGSALQGPASPQTLSWVDNVSQNTAGDNALLSTVQSTGASVTLADPISPADFFGMTAVELKAANAVTTTASLTQNFSYVPGYTYSFSGEMSGTGKVRLGFQTGASQTPTYTPDLTLTGELQRFALTLPMPNPAPGGTSSFIIGADAAGDAVTFKAGQFKAETYPVPTAYRADTPCAVTPATGACTQPAPSPAVADGMVSLSYCDDFTYSTVASMMDTAPYADNKPWVDGLWYEQPHGLSSYAVGNSHFTITAPAAVNTTTEYHDTSGGRFFTPPFYAEAYINGNNWFAFWFIAQAWTQGSCAFGGASEIDVIESDTAAGGTAFTTLHSDSSNGCNATDQSKDCFAAMPNGGSTQNQWHLYGALVDPANNRVDFYVDNQLVCHETPYANTQQAYAMILGDGPGGVNGGAPVGTPMATWDYVRVWTAP